jgi:hypothetical protein
MSHDVGSVEGLRRLGRQTQSGVVVVEGEAGRLHASAVLLRPQQRRQTLRRRRRLRLAASGGAAAAAARVTRLRTHHGGRLLGRHCRGRLASAALLAAAALVRVVLGFGLLLRLLAALPLHPPILEPDFHLQHNKTDPNLTKMLSSENIIEMKARSLIKMKNKLVGKN